MKDYVLARKPLTSSGFTVIEIAMALVIVCMLLGGLMKGTEFLENTKVRSSIADVNSIAQAFNGYIDRYRALPGDDSNFHSRGDTWASLTAEGNSNGRLFAAREHTFTGQGEQAGFWSHLRAAGLIKGDAALVGKAALPKNAFGGYIGITSANVNNALRGIKVCLSQVPGDSATALDRQMDDGDAATGNMRASISPAQMQNVAPSVAMVATGYQSESAYTLCMRI